MIPIYSTTVLYDYSLRAVMVISKYLYSTVETTIKDSPENIITMVLQQYNYLAYTPLHALPSGHSVMCLRTSFTVAQRGN